MTDVLENLEQEESVAPDRLDNSGQILGYVQAAQQDALARNNQSVTPEHVLKADLDDPKKEGASIIEDAGGSTSEIKQATEKGSDKVGTSADADASKKGDAAAKKPVERGPDASTSKELHRTESSSEITSDSSTFIESSASLIAGLGLDTTVNLAFSFEAEAAPGAFTVLGFAGEEALFEGYEISVDLISVNPLLDLADLLDTPAVLTLLHAFEMPRFLHGVIVSVKRGSTSLFRTFYRVTLKPALHRLNYHSDSRIFQRQSVPEITKTILAEHGIIDVDWQLEGAHEAREFCVQYQETSYDFLRRLWAEEGMFFWFEHSVMSHRMIVSDAPLAIPMLPGDAVFRYNDMSDWIGKDTCIDRFERTEQLRATHRVAGDYSFLVPAQTLTERAAQYASDGAKREYELFAWPGRYKTAEVGRAFNDYALQAHRVDAAVAEGETNSVRLTAGYAIMLVDHPDIPANTVHRLRRVIHEGHQPIVLLEDAPTDAATTYRARFSTQPARLPYRPVNPNPRPRIEGPQIAHVTGPEGEEIYCDEHGRVKLWFPWDRRGKKDDTSSCWIRVAQNWAGGGWGQMAIPRVGHQVVVEFLDGDPDQPLITGRTYHATNKPPYDLPENKTRMTIKSRTHKGEGYNELRFEDEAGREEVFLRAQRDQNTEIVNDERHAIGHDSAKEVGNNRSENIGHDKTETVGNDKSESVGNDKSETVGHDKSTSIKNDSTESVGHDARLNVVNDAFYEVGQNQHEKYGKDHQYSVGNILKESVFADHFYEAGGKFEGVVNGTYKLDVGDTITTNTGKHQLMAFEKFEISGPGGKITIDAKGITLEAPNIFLKGKVTMGGSGGAQVPALELAAKEGRPFCEECAQADGE